MVPAQPDRQVADPALSGDGRAVAFRSIGPGGDSAIEVFDLEAGPVWELKTPPAHEPGMELSPNGRWLVFQASEIEGAQCDRITRVVSQTGTPTLEPLERPFIHDIETGRTWCPPLPSATANVPIQTSLAGVNDTAVAYSYMVGKSPPNADGGYEIAGVRFIRYSLLSSTSNEIFDSDDLSFCCAGPPALSTSTVAWGPWRADGIDLFEPFPAVHRLAGFRPAQLQSEGLQYHDPSLSADGLSLTYGIRGIDGTTGKQRDEIYVTSR
jgi:hypothetical protein